jgi:hypothetical protein
MCGHMAGGEGGGGGGAAAVADVPSLAVRVVAGDGDGAYLEVIAYLCGQLHQRILQASGFRLEGADGG